MASYNNSFNGGGTATSRRRPKRQRTPTTIYSDDNPTTFTTKKKKGGCNISGNERNHQEEVDLLYSKSRTDVSSKRWSLDETITRGMPPPEPVLTAKRGPGRPPRRKPAEEMTSVPEDELPNTVTSAHSIATSVISDSSSTNTATIDQTEPSVTVAKRKRGRPPKSRSRDLSVTSDENCVEGKYVDSNGDKGGDRNEAVVARSSSLAVITKSNKTSDNPINTKSNRRSKSSDISTSKMSQNTRHSKSKPKLIQSNERKNLDGTSSPNSRTTGDSDGNTTPLLFRNTISGIPRKEDTEGTFINHSITLAPILPLTVGHDNDKSSTSRLSREFASMYPAVFDIGVPKSCSNISSSFLSSNQTGTSSATSNKHNQSQQPRMPMWTPLYDPPVFFEDDYDQETGKIDFDNTIPVARNITAITVRKPNNDYLVIGDSIGFVTVYSLAKDSINIPIAQLESVACQQRGKIEQDRLRAETRKRAKQNSKGGKGGTRYSSSSNYVNNSSKGGALFSSNHNGRSGISSPFLATGPQHVRSILIDTSDTTIHALGMIESRVVLATSEELECMDVPSGTSLWVCPLSSSRFVTSLDMHLRTFDVLVSCSKTGGNSNASSINDDSTEAMATAISPLMLLQHAKNNVEICDANSSMLVRSPFCSAIWDIGAENRLLFIALSSNRQELQLVLVSGGSIDSWKVACKTKIPTKAASSVSAMTKLSQSPGGLYTLVASSRGIRLYQTESLQLIHVYGDQLALHGQAVIWKDCWLAGSYFSETEGCRKNSDGSPSQSLECDDWLGQLTNDGKVDNNRINSMETYKKNVNEESDKLAVISSIPDLAPYIIGVPHTKGPKELCESLHVWKVEHPSVVPIMSIPLPPKGEGALGLVGGGDPSSKRFNCNTGVSEDRIILVTNTGQGYVMLPEMESNFAGIMYPPGYQLITDNIEYIEEEDALDKPLDSESANKEEVEDIEILNNHDDNDDESIDEELKEAMRQSLLEHERQQKVAKEVVKHDENVDIIFTKSKKEERKYLPCRPEPYLRQMINNTLFEDEVSKDYNGNSEESTYFNIGNELSISLDSSNENSKKKLTGATFISLVLDKMPNMQKSEPLEEDCLSFTTTKVVVAVNPVVPARQGRGKKSRAANLESILKASINPYLQSLMFSKQSVAVDGVGSQLRELYAFGNGHVTKAHVVNETRTQISPSTESSAYTVRNQLNDPTGKDNGESFSLGSSSSGCFKKEVGGDSLRLDQQSNSSPRQATNDDEAAVVMGLLGLSPFQAPKPTITNIVSSVSTEHGIGNNATYPNTSLLSSMVAKPTVNHATKNTIQFPFSRERIKSDGFNSMPEPVVEKQRPRMIDTSCMACRGRLVIHSCGKRALPVDHEEVARAEKEYIAREEEEKKRIRAEKSRFAAQKRKEAKKQKQLELGEQKLQKEKEHPTEHRTSFQDDFTTCALEQIVTSHANQVVVNQTGHPTQLISRGIKAVDPINERQISRISSVDGHCEARNLTLPQNLGPQAFTNTTTSSSQSFSTSFDRCSQSQTHDELSQPSIYGQNALAHNDTAKLNFIQSIEPIDQNKSAVSNLNAFQEHIPLTIPDRSLLVQSTVPSASATLASADALLGLANIADNFMKPTLNDTVNHNCLHESKLSDWSTATYTDVRLSDVSASRRIESSELKRGIPSYATIRGQLNHGTSNEFSDTGTATESGQHSYANGYGAGESYPRSSRSEES